jgi:large conductance mechanosensitive channel
MNSFFKEFRDFAIRGNVVDMAVGVIIGGAFGKIVSSVVNDIIMPPIGWIIGGVNFKDLKVTLPVLTTNSEASAPATINYGNFIQTVIDFAIIAFCVFLIIKLINRFTKKKAVEDEKNKPSVPVQSKEEILLTEIRDLLKDNISDKH